MLRTVTVICERAVVAHIRARDETACDSAIPPVTGVAVPGLLHGASGELSAGAGPRACHQAALLSGGRHDRDHREQVEEQRNAAGSDTREPGQISDNGWR